MSCLLWNACSLQNKLDVFTALLEDEDLDIAAVTETWMSAQQNNITAELRDKGYQIYHFNREERKGGGVALIFRDNFKFLSGKTFNCENFECILVTIACHAARPINFIVLYRYCEVAPSTFLTEFYKFMENIFIDFKNVIILGDFNLHLNEKFNPTTIKFHDILNSFSLTQEIEVPTHKLGNTLDLVIHDTSDTPISHLYTDFTTRSDHAYIFFKLAQDLEVNSKKTVSIKSFKNVDLVKFKSDIVSKVEDYVFNTDRDFHGALNDFNNLCNQCLDKHVETKYIEINNTPSLSGWIRSLGRPALNAGNSTRYGNARETTQIDLILLMPDKLLQKWHLKNDAHFTLKVLKTVIIPTRNFLEFVETC